jgi:enoyl-CoA hydratase/carnithine racemase
MAYEYERLRVELADGVATATIDNPPINIMSMRLLRELALFADEVADDADVRVVILDSANPDFFIAHFDVETILRLPISDAPDRDAPPNIFALMCGRFRTMPKATIAKIEGRIGGGGASVAAAMDMRFGASGRFVLNQPEVALGILATNTGTQTLPRLVGPARSLEILLGCDDIDAETAELWGWLNRALPADELGPFVNRLAARIASFPELAAALTKQSVLTAELPPTEALRDEAIFFERAIRDEAAQTALRRFLEVGGQTAEGEQRLGELLSEL